MSRRIKGLLLLPALALVVSLLPWSPREVWQAGAARIGAFRDDSRALASGEYQERIAASWREEAQAVREAMRVQASDEMQRELMAARQKLLDDRAAALDHHAAQLMKGDLESLKRQVADNVRNAGGGN